MVHAIPLPEGFEPGFAGAALDAALDADTLVVGSQRGVACIDLAAGDTRWVHRAPPEGERACTVWGGRVQLTDRAVHFLHHAVGGCAVSALDRESGAVVWRTEIRTPPSGPVPRLAVRPPITALLVRHPQVTCVAVSHEPMRLGSSPHPINREGIELNRLDRESGRVEWVVRDDGVHVTALHARNYEGVHRIGPDLRFVDWENGTIRTLYSAPGDLCWPVLSSHHAGVAFRTARGGVGATVLHRRLGSIAVDAVWREAGVTELVMHRDGPNWLVQTRSGRLSLLDPERNALRWTAKTPQWVYGVASAADPNRIHVGTMGARGGLYTLDAMEGTEVAVRRVRGGAWQPVRAGAFVVSPTGEGLLVADGASGASRMIGMGEALAQEVIGPWQDRLVLLRSRGDRDSDVALVEVDGD